MCYNKGAEGVARKIGGRDAVAAQDGSQRPHDVVDALRAHAQTQRNVPHFKQNKWSVCTTCEACMR